MSNEWADIEQKEDKIGNREIFLDILRIAATSAVVLMHTVTGVWDNTDMSAYPAELTVFMVVKDLITWCVPIFLLISGYLFLDPRRKITLWQMLWKYCGRIVLALFLFGVPFACMELISTTQVFEPWMLWESVMMVLRGQSWSHLWYLYMILGLYLITPALKYLLKNCPAWLLYIVLGILAAGCSIYPYLQKLFAWEQAVMPPDAGIYLFYYLCGYLFVTGKCSQNTKVRKLRSVNMAAAVILPVGMAISRLVGDYEMQMAYNYPFTVLWSLAIFYLAWNRETDAERAPSVTEAAVKMSSLCFAVYLVHPIFVNFAYKFLHITLLDFPIWLSLPCFYTVILGLSILVAWILRRIPWMSKYVL
ncbi:MAG: acyltransferase family protein [Candidatus Gastranaerophilales bacterium]|nr:acyltransferase family protein [Candidatus Gastranaerophilales bacterium]